MKTPASSPSPLTRRKFIGELSLGAAALALASHSRAQTAPAEKKLGIALVGLGSYATGQLGPALRKTKSCRLAGVVTGSADKGRRWAADYGFSEKTFTATTRWRGSRTIRTSTSSTWSRRTRCTPSTASPRPWRASR